MAPEGEDAGGALDPDAGADADAGAKADRPPVAVLGAGYVGVATAAVLAERGHRVTVVDPVEAKVEALAAGEVPFHEPGLPEVVAAQVAAGRLTAVPSVDDVGDAAYIYLCVGTPAADDGSVDLGQVRSAAADAGRLAAAQDGFATIVVKSTVPPGTARDVVGPRAAEAYVQAEAGGGGAGGGPGEAFGLVSNPEFLREGSALLDARDPDRVVVGTDDDASRKAMEALLADAERAGTPLFWLDTAGAEAVKYVSNAFLALKISFANEAANLCRRLGVDWMQVRDAVGADDRIGSAFLVPGAGFGGSCFPKDVRGLRAVTRAAGVEPRLLDALLAVNEAQPAEVATLVEAAVAGNADEGHETGDGGGPLDGVRVALLGLAFKPGTDDVRETRALPLWRALVDRGADVVCHDPMAGAREAFQGLAPDAAIVDDLDAALDGADVAVLQTAWPEYVDLPADRWPARLVDARRAFDADAFGALAEAGVAVWAVGRGPP